MRSGIHGTFATLLLMVPVLSIPALAIFGIPQFAPVVASPLDEGPGRDRERKVGQSARLHAEHPDEFEDAMGSDGEPAESQPGMAPGHMSDSVPVSRVNRNAGLRNPPVAGRPNPVASNAASHSNWQDEPLPDPRTVKEFEGTAQVRPADRSAIEGRERFQDYRQIPGDAGHTRVQPASMANAPAHMPGMPRPFARPRERASEESGPVTAVATDAEPLTWQGAVRRLNELEIRNFRLQPGHRENEFMFICSYTPTDSPRVSYRFEAEADEPLKAVEKVLEQIVEWQHRR